MVCTVCMRIKALVIIYSNKNTPEFLSLSPCLDVWCFLRICARSRAIPAGFSSAVLSYRLNIISFIYQFRNDIIRKYPEEYSTVNKVGWNEKPLARGNPVSCRINCLLDREQYFFLL